MGDTAWGWAGAAVGGVGAAGGGVGWENELNGHTHKTAREVLGDHIRLGRHVRRLQK